MGQRSFGNCEADNQTMSPWSSLNDRGIPLIDTVTFTQLAPPNPPVKLQLPSISLLRRRILKHLFVSMQCSFNDTPRVTKKMNQKNCGIHE